MVVGMVLGAAGMSVANWLKTVLLTAGVPPGTDSANAAACRCSLVCTLSRQAWRLPGRLGRFQSSQV